MEETIRNILNKYKDFPNQIYHYTDGNAFLSILKHKELWASHILFQNDKKEALYSLELLHEVLKEKEKIFHEYNCNIEEIFDFVKTFTGQNTFTISFSKKRDDLNQWRGYANSQLSYCIGFAPLELKDINIPLKEESIENKKDSSIKPNQNITLIFQCLYETRVQKQLIEAIIDKQFYNKPDKDKLNSIGIAGNIMTDFLPVSTLFKHPCFKDEEEIRLVIDYVNNDLIDIRIGKERFIPYIKVPIKTENIKDIIIGPCDNEEFIYTQTTYVCQRYDIGFSKGERRNLLKSELPFRK